MAGCERYPAGIPAGGEGRLLGVAFALDGMITPSGSRHHLPRAPERPLRSPQVLERLAGEVLVLAHVLVVDVRADELPAEVAAVKRTLRRQRFWGNERMDEIKEMKKETERMEADPNVHRGII